MSRSNKQETGLWFSIRNTIITGILNLLLSQEGFAQYPSLKQMASGATMQVSNSKTSLVFCLAWVYGNNFYAKGCLFSAVGIKTQVWSHITSPMKRFKNTDTLASL